MFHRGTLRLYQVGVFVFIDPLSPEENGIIVCIYIVLTMGWVDLPKFFCAFLETLMDLVNALVDKELPIPAYGAIY